MQDQSLPTNFMLGELRSGTFGELSREDKYFEMEEDDSRVKVELFKNYQLGINDLLKHLGVFGTTGSGKTVTLARILEIYAENNIAFTCWDYESTSFYTIPEVYPRVKYMKLEPLLDEGTYRHIINHSKDYRQYFEGRELDIARVPEAQEAVEKVREMAERNYLTSAQQIFSFENLPDALMSGCIAYIYTQRLWELADEHHQAGNDVLHISIFDEGHWAMPFPTAQIVWTIYTSKMLEICSRIVSKGRKRWLLLDVASQRLPDIAVPVRSQLQSILLQKASTKDVPFYEEFMKNLSLLARKELGASSLNLAPGQAMFVHDGWVNNAMKVVYRKSRHPDQNASYYKAMKRAEKAREAFNKEEENRG